MSAVSYDLAVWTGPKPATDADALREYVRRTDDLEELDDDELAPAVPEIEAFLTETLDRYPPLDDEDDESCPWATGPEPGDVNGDFALITMTYPGARAALDGVVEIAHRHGLVCFDPQADALV